ncbi:MAG: 3-phosphoshikimate 1-carboxyvinyltransferase [Thermodesulfovibrionia bacterium]|nr:3-phosphoshikimate 1-carboxyvinyltransferase [Thermodesulfovibrionia bacterium]
MNQIKVCHSDPLKGEASPPPDKSISHRAVIFSSLAEGRSVIENFLAAEDPMRTLEAFRQMGIEIEQSADGRTVTIIGKGLRGLSEPVGPIDCGNSGTTMRMMSGVLSGQPFSSTLTGDRYLLKRPMQRVIGPLTKMGAVITSESGGLPPLHIKGGNLSPIKYNSPVASAQVKSAILLAGLYCNGITTVVEPERSRDHTERMLRAAGVDINVQGLEVSIKGPARLNPMDIRVPADFSSAAFFIVAGLLVPGSEVLIKDVGINQTRTGLLDILIMMGASIQLLNQRDISGEPVADIFVKHSSLSGIETGGEMLLRAIDEFPILCVVAALADGTTKITGAKELRVKESDRIAAMALELAKMGVKVEELPDGIIIKGNESLKAAKVHSHGDHRIAMSMVVAGFMAKGETTVDDTECIDTSFPGFMDMMNRLRQ